MNDDLVCQVVELLERLHTHVEIKRKKTDNVYVYVEGTFRFMKDEELERFICEVSNLGWADNKAGSSCSES